MYGGSGKAGRGGGGGRGSGGGVGKRNIHSTFHPPPLHRSSGRLSIGSGGGGPGPGSGPRGRTTSDGPTTSSAAGGTEESFSLVTGKPLNFAMMIRLAPDLVEEIKRVEEQGGSARIKFDAVANHSGGNVINVGGKDFRFTWSREPGDLCDIYEDRKSGEDGNGMLVESGCAWRKLNVQRVLDESTKNHVKMRSEEAERKQKSRKAIILDPANPSMKNQMKQLAAAETNPWRTPFMKKEPPLKKRKPEPLPGGPPKSVYKTGLSTATSSKGRHSTSPVASPPEQSAVPASPFAMNTTISSEKEIPSKVTSSARRDIRGSNREVGKPADLRSMLISLLKENPLGMSIKALEKAVGDAFPNSVKQIEHIIKKIATYQAPGKYLLKPEVEFEGFEKPYPKDGSSPLDNHHRSPIHAPYVQPPAPGPVFFVRTDSNEINELALESKPGEVLSDLEKVDIEHHSPDIFGEKKISDNARPVGSSSDSGSDSDSESDSSDSSDSGSRSRSRSKSKSPVGSGSASSDSESDASLNSKQASDQDVDIMTSDDDKESKHKLPASESGSLKSPFAWRSTNGEPGDIEIDDHVVDVVEIERDLLDDNPVGQVTGSVSNKGNKPDEETKPPSPEWNAHRRSQVYAGQYYNEREKIVREDPKQGQFDNCLNLPKSKSKRGFDEKYSDGKTDGTQRAKPANVSQSLVSGIKKIPQNSSPDRHHTQMTNITAREGIADFALKKGYNHESSGRSNIDIQQPSQRYVDSVAREKDPAAVDRPGKHAESVGRGVKYSERSLQTREGFPLQRDKSSRGSHDDDGSINDKRPSNLSKEGVGNKLSTPVGSHYRKHDMLGKFKEGGNVSNMQTEYSLKDEDTNELDRSHIENGRGKTLRREPSLEVGEFREPLPEETLGYRKPFERNSSFKKSGSKSTSSDYWNSDSNTGRPAGRVIAESRKTPPPTSKIAISGVPEGSKRRNPDSHRTGQPLPEQHHSSVDYTDLSSQHNKLAEVNSNSRHSDAGMGLGTVNLQHQKDSRRGVGPSSSREIKKQQPNSSIDLNDRRKDTSLTGSNDAGQKRRESSSDENSCSYSKYEKEEPELKEPIKDISQYEEYVQEYNEKYESYLSLDKILESYRIEFTQVGKDLEASKGKDMERYNVLVAQLKESYRQCGPRVQRLKKIFAVMHEELKHLKQMIKDFYDSYGKD